MKHLHILIPTFLFALQSFAQPTQKWAKTFNYTSNGMDKVADIKTLSCYVYVTGVSYNAGTGNDYLTIKYNLQGDTVWTRRYNNTGDDVPVSMAVDGAGNVYVTGNSQGNGTGSDYATVKYDANGNIQWGGQNELLMWVMI